MQVSNWIWALFGVVVLAALAFDLGMLRTSRGEERELTVRSAAIRSAAWIALALVFALSVAASIIWPGRPGQYSAKASSG